MICLTTTRCSPTSDSVWHPRIKLCSKVDQVRMFLATSRTSRISVEIRAIHTRRNAAYGSQRCLIDPPLRSESFQSTIDRSVPMTGVFNSPIPFMVFRRRISRELLFALAQSLVCPVSGWSKINLASVSTD